MTTSRLGAKIASNPAEWKLKPLGKVAPMILYQIEIDTPGNQRNN